MILLDQQEISLQQLKDKLEFPHVLFQHCGSVVAEHTKSRSRMMVCFEEGAGYYLNYQEKSRADEEWLSLADIHLLSTVIEYDEDCYASLGLFLPIKDAIPAIESFALSGNRCNLITWISVDEMPEDSNW